MVKLYRQSIVCTHAMIDAFLQSISDQSSLDRILVSLHSIIASATDHLPIITSEKPTLQLNSPALLGLRRPEALGLMSQGISSESSMGRYLAALKQLVRVTIVYDAADEFFQV